VKRQRWWLAVAVAFLVAGNVWRWWPQGSEQERAPAALEPVDRRVVPAIEDFALHTAAVARDPATKMTRDLFQPKLPPAPPPVKKPVVTEPPPKTPEQLAEEAARAELAQIKVMGIVFRGTKGQAFLLKGDQTYLVQAGEKVGERFQVVEIRTDSVQLKDPVTQVGGQLPVSGK
jgi:Tfp pilus assembly protein PilP